jgi:hypothetical protein
MIKHGHIHKVANIPAVFLPSWSDRALRCGTFLDLHRGLVVVIIIVLIIIIVLYNYLKKANI